VKRALFSPSQVQSLLTDGCRNAGSRIGDLPFLERLAIDHPGGILMLSEGLSVHHHDIDGGLNRMIEQRVIDAA
jgi:hypothetical protein